MARPKDRLVQVEIYGQRYSLRADENTVPSHVEQVAALVDRRMRELAETTPTVDSFKVAVLAAVNIADELLQLRGERKVVEDYIAAKTRDIEALLDESIKAAR